MRQTVSGALMYVNLLFPIMFLQKYFFFIVLHPVFIIPAKECDEAF